MAYQSYEDKAAEEKEAAVTRAVSAQKRAAEVERLSKDRKKAKAKAMAMQAEVDALKAELETRKAGKPATPKPETQITPAARSTWASIAEVKSEDSTPSTDPGHAKGVIPTNADYRRWMGK